jgi:AAHS family 3-hydroxyphenylpropionic acid transporter
MVAVMFGLGVVEGYYPTLILSGLAGFLVLGASYALYSLAPGYYPPAERGAGLGAAVAVGRLGSIAGPLLAGQMLAGGASADRVLSTMVPVAVAAGTAVLLLSFLKKAG